MTLGNLTKETIKLNHIFAYIQMGSDKVNIGECGTIYIHRKAKARYKILSAKKLEEYKFEVTAKIIQLY